MSKTEPSAVERARARFFEVSPAPLAILSFDGVIRDANPAWTALFGAVVADDSLLGRVAAADRRPLAAALDGLRAGGASSLRLRLCGADGQEHHRACELTAESDGDCVYCVAREAPAHAESVQAALIRALDAMESLGLYMIAADDGVEPRVVYANAGAARIAAIADLQQRARSADLTHAEVLRHVDGVTEDASPPGTPAASAELVTRMRDGRTVVWVALPLDPERDQLRGRLFVAKDVTERKLVESAAARALERLQRSEREFRRLLEHVTDGIVVMREGTFAYANPAAARILGYDAPADLIGIHFASIVRPEELTESDERVRRMGGAAPPPRRLRPMVRRDGSTVYAETLGFPTELDGEPATLVIAHDVTEELRLEAQMRQAERLASLGTLSATIAHEVNNPLTYILLNLQLTRRWLGQLARENPSTLLLDALRLIEQSLEGAERVASSSVICVASPARTTRAPSSWTYVPCLIRSFRWRSTSCESAPSSCATTTKGRRNLGSAPTPCSSATSS